MSVYRKDSSGNIVKIAGSLVQRINNIILPTAYSLVDGVEYYDVTEAADAYISGLADYTNYSFNIDTPNTTQNVYFRYKDKTLKLITPEGELPDIESVSGNFICYTLSASTSGNIYIKEFGTTLEAGRNLTIEDNVISLKNALTGVNIVRSEGSVQRLYNSLDYGVLTNGTEVQLILKSPQLFKIQTNATHPIYVDSAGTTHDVALLDEVVTSSGDDNIIVDNNTISLNNELTGIMKIDNGKDSQSSLTFSTSESFGETAYLEIPNYAGTSTRKLGLEGSSNRPLYVEGTNRHLLPYYDEVVLLTNAQTITGKKTYTVRPNLQENGDTSEFATLGDLSNYVAVQSDNANTYAQVTNENGAVTISITENATNHTLRVDNTGAYVDDHQIASVDDVTNSATSLTNDYTSKIAATDSRVTTLDTAVTSNTNAIVTVNSTLSSHTQQLERLSGTTLRLLYAAGTSPTATEINLFVTSKGYSAPFSGVAVVVDGTYHVWHYYENTSSWKDDGTDTVTTFTNTSLGVIKGSTATGAIGANSDGTGVVNGWSAAMTSISTNTTNISTVSGKVTSLETLTAGHTTSIADLNTEVEKLQDAIVSGGAVLYDTTGMNTDGAMTQAATTTELNNRITKNMLDIYAGNVDKCNTNGVDGICTNLYKTDGSFYTSRQFLFPDFIATSDDTTNKHTFSIDTDKFATVEDMTSTVSEALTPVYETITSVNEKTLDIVQVDLGDDGDIQSTAISVEDAWKLYNGRAILKLAAGSNKYIFFRVGDYISTNEAMLYSTVSDGTLRTALGITTSVGIVGLYLTISSSGSTIWPIVRNIAEKTSQLTNDSGFITSASLPTIVQTTGTSTTAVMSQAAVTEAVNNISIDTSNFAKLDSEDTQTFKGLVSFKKPLLTQVDEDKFAQISHEVSYLYNMDSETNSGAVFSIINDSNLVGISASAVKEDDEILVGLVVENRVPVLIGAADANEVRLLLPFESGSGTIATQEYVTSVMPTFTYDSDTKTLTITT